MSSFSRGCACPLIVHAALTCRDVYLPHTVSGKITLPLLKPQRDCGASGVGLKGNGLELQWKCGKRAVNSESLLSGVNCKWEESGCVF